MTRVEVVEHQLVWRKNFADVSTELNLVYAGFEVDVEHIGSTSVDSLCAKPVIDVLLGADSLETISSRTAELQQALYVYRPNYELQIPLRRYFVRDAGAGPRVHLHGVVKGGALWTNHLLFRDVLRRDPAVARRYADLKRGLAQEFANDKAAYTEGKSGFIAEVLAHAR